MKSKNIKRYSTLIPKGLIVFLEFWLGSYGMSVGPKIFIFIRLNLVFKIYKGLKDKIEKTKSSL